MKKGKRVVAFWLSLSALLLPLTSAWAEAWPSKPINVLVGFSPGGGVDQMARQLATSLGKVLKQPLIIQNKPGAGGGVAAMNAKGAPADGYTLLVTIANTYTAETVGGKMQYATGDFQHIAAFALFQEAFVSQSNRPWKDFKGMIDYAKKSGTDLKYASISEVDRMVTRRISKREGVKLIPVPVKGGADVMPAILGGHVDFGYSGGALHAPHVKTGTMIVLAGSGEDRLEDHPRLPTVKELGYGTAVVNYCMISAPKGLPADILRRLEDGVRTVTKDPQFVDLVKDKLSLRPVFLGSGEVTPKVAQLAKEFETMNAEK